MKTVLSSLSSPKQNKDSSAFSFQNENIKSIFLALTKRRKLKLCKCYYLCQVAISVYLKHITLVVLMVVWSNGVARVVAARKIDVATGVASGIATGVIT